MDLLPFLLFLQSLKEVFLAVDVGHFFLQFEITPKISIKEDRRCGPLISRPTSMYSLSLLIPVLLDNPGGVYKNAGRFRPGQGLLRKKHA